MKKSKLWMGCLLILVVAAVLAFTVRQGREAAAPEFKTAVVDRGKLQAIVASTGTVNPVNTVIVGSQVSGNIKEIYVDYNSIVQKDQVVARIDAAVYEAQLDTGRSAAAAWRKPNCRRNKKSRRPSAPALIAPGRICARPGPLSGKPVCNLIG